MNSFDEFVTLWENETKNVKIKKEFNHMLFLVVYPYQKRKTKLGTFSFNILIDEDTYDYNYFSKTVSF